MKFDTGVYVIENLVNGRRYIGSAVSIKKRWREHLRQLGEGRHHSRYLQRAWVKHGSSNFKFRPLLYCNRSNLISYEQAAMDVYSPEYNIVPVAGSQLGYRHSDETRAKLRAARAKNGFSPMRGRTHTEESKKKISENRKGKGGGGWTQQRRDRISAALKGRVVPKERRLKISRKLMGHVQSTETIEKRAMKLRGRKRSPAFAEAQRKRMLGSKMKPEAVEKMARSKAKLTDEQVIEIRRLRDSGVARKTLSSLFQIDPASITNIVKRTSYRWVP